tara:strand:- start:16425 stop:17111 length:687 start_codon:yes stop_codon:yes gene_type:complete
MTNSEPQNRNFVKKLAFVGGTLLLAYLFANSLIDSKFNDLEKSVRAQIASQETTLAAIAETTARNGADTITESIVRDCSIKERSSFDDLLGRLNDGLARYELVELERLFGRCGSFFSERKTIMVTRLAREIEIFETTVNQLAILEGDRVLGDYQVEQWKALSAEEKKQSELFAELVKKQDQIISTLLEGKSADSPEIIEILQEVREIQETLIVANKQASDIRKQLISL